MLGLHLFTVADLLENCTQTSYAHFSLFAFMWFNLLERRQRKLASSCWIRSRLFFLACFAVTTFCCHARGDHGYPVVLVTGNSDVDLHAWCFRYKPSLQKATCALLSMCFSTLGPNSKISKLVVTMLLQSAVQSKAPCSCFSNLYFFYPYALRMTTVAQRFFSRHHQPPHLVRENVGVV